MSAGRSRTVRTPANEYGVIPTVEQEPLRSSREIKRELELSQQRVLEELHDDELYPYEVLSESSRTR
jgi:hypothetical protein